MCNRAQQHCTVFHDMRRVHAGVSVQNNCTSSHHTSSNPVHFLLQMPAHAPTVACCNLLVVTGCDTSLDLASAMYCWQLRSSSISSISCASAKILCLRLAIQASPQISSLLLVLLALVDAAAGSATTLIGPMAAALHNTHASRTACQFDCATRDKQVSLLLMILASLSNMHQQAH